MVMARLLMFDTQCHYIQTNVFNWIPSDESVWFGVLHLGSHLSLHFQFAP